MAPMVSEVRDAGAVDRAATRSRRHLRHGGLARAIRQRAQGSVARRVAVAVAVPAVVSGCADPCHDDGRGVRASPTGSVTRRRGPREAGYDGVQLGSANAKLMDQFLSPLYNRRTDEFGGSVEARFRILKVIRDAIAERAGDDYPVLVKIPSERAPFPGLKHASAEDCIRMCVLAEEAGFAAITPVEVGTCRTRHCPGAVFPAHSGSRRRWSTASTPRRRSEGDGSPCPPATSSVGCAARSDRYGTATSSRQRRSG